MNSPELVSKPKEDDRLIPFRPLDRWWLAQVLGKRFSQELDLERDQPPKR